MKPTLLFAFVLLFFTANAQIQLTDFKSSTNISSNPRNFVAFKNNAFFLANDNLGNNLLWVTDGTEAGTKPFLSPSIPTESAPFSSFIEGDTLYFAFDKCFWKMGKDRNPIQIVCYKYFYPMNELVKIGNRIYFTFTEYYDLVSHSIKVSTNELARRSFFTTWGVVKAADDFFIVDYGYGTGIWQTVHVQFADSDSLHYLKNFGNDYPTAAFKLKNKRFFSTSGAIYEVTKDTFYLRQIFPSGTLKTLVTDNEFLLVQYETKTVVNNSPLPVSQVTKKTTTTLYKYVFDGDSVITTNEITLQDVSFISPLVMHNEHIFYGVVQYNKNTPTDGSIVRFNFENNTVKQITNTKEFNTYYNFTSDNDYTYISSPYTSNLLFKINKSTGEFTQENGALGLTFDRRKVSIGNTKIGAYIEKQSNGIADVELYRFDKETPQQIKNIVDYGLNYSLALLPSKDFSTGYLFVNEAKKGGMIYTLNPKNNELRELDKDATIQYVVPKQVPSPIGLFRVIDENSSLYGGTKTVLIEESFLKTKIEKQRLESNQTPVLLHTTDLAAYFLIKNSIYKVPFEKDTPSKVIANAEFPSSIYDYNNKIGNYFFLQNYETYTSYVLNIADESIHFVENENTRWLGKWRNAMLLQDKDKVYAYKVVGNELKKHFLFDVQLEEYGFPPSLNFSGSEDFFVLSAYNQIWHSDGTCQNSVKIWSKKHISEKSLYTVKFTNKGVLLRDNEKQFYYFENNKLEKCKLPSILETTNYGISNNFFYYSTNLLYPEAVADTLFRYDFQTAINEQLAIVNRKSASITNFRFETVWQKEKVKVLILNTQMYLIDEKSNGDEEIELVYKAKEEQSFLYFSTVLNNDVLILQSDGDFIFYDGAKTSILYGEGFYTNAQASSDRFVYLCNSSKWILRIDKTTHEFKKIEIKTPLSIYSLQIISNKLFAICLNDASGIQLWEIDKDENQNPLMVVSQPNKIIATSECEEQQIKSENFQSNAFLYPNPASVVLNLVIPNDTIYTQARKFTIIDMTGKTYKEVIGIPTSGVLSSEFEIDIHDIPSKNMYFVLFMNENNKPHAIRFYKE